MPDLPHGGPAAPHLTATTIRVALILVLHGIPKERQPPIVRALDRDRRAHGGIRAMMERLSDLPVPEDDHGPQS